MRVHVRRSLRAVLVAVMVAAVMAPAGAVRAAQREAPTPEQLAGPACTQLQKDIGSRFAAVFGSYAGCLSKVANVARAATEACKTAADPGPCIEQALQKGIKALVTAPSADDLAKQMCGRLQADLGARFARKFGSVAGCLTKVGAIARAAVEKCKTAADQATCIEQESKKALAELAREGGPTAAQIGDAITLAACEAAQEQLGSKFEQQLGSLAGCRAKIQAQAAKLASDALERCAGAEDPEPCVRREIEIGSTAVRLALGAGAAPTAEQIGDDIAGRACEAAKQKLGPRFAKQLGSLDSCKARIRAEATRLGSSALAACRTAFDKERCLRQELQTAAVSLQSALGAGTEPTAAEITDEITGQACQAAREQLRARFAARFSSFEACRQSIEKKVAALVKKDLNLCRDDPDRESCIRALIEKWAVSLQADLGAEAGPSAADVGGAVAAQACTFARARMGWQRFTKLLGSDDSCRQKILGEAKQVAGAAIARCKTAWDRDACIRQEIETAAVSLQLALSDVEPTAAQVGDEIAGEACLSAQATLRAGFERRYGSFEGCKAKIMAKAVQLARAAITGCRSAASPWACIRKAIEVEAGALKAALGLGP